MVGIFWFKNSWRASINAQYLQSNDISFEIHHPLFDAIVLKQGAQLVHFQPKGSEPLLWSAELSTFEKGKAFRGGIPLCWPWFGKAGVPSHGFARIVEWELVQYTESYERVGFVFELHDSAHTRAIWPHAFNVQLAMTLGEDVELFLHVKAEQESTAALHSYIACKEINDVTLTGLGPIYKDALQDGKQCFEAKTVLHVNHAVDRIYTQPEARTILCEKEGRVCISHENQSDVVVWNPWSEGSAKLADMKEGDYTKMLCIETARITHPLKPHDSLHVKILREHLR